MGTFTQLIYQVVFTGKYRQPFLNENNQGDLYAYMGGILNNLGCMPHIVGGHVDHVHIIYSATGKYSVGKIVQVIKNSTNVYMHDRSSHYPSFTRWQVGYGAFSYMKSDLPRLIEYVKGQESHHKKTRFKEEYVKLLEEHGISYDLQYVFL